MSAVEGAEPAVTSDQQPETSESLKDSHGEKPSNAGEQADKEADSSSSPGISLPTEQNVDMAPNGVEGHGTDLKAEETEPLPSTLQVNKPDEDSMSEGTDVYEEDTSWRHYLDDKNLAERRKKAPKRVKQYSDYIKLMEDRRTADVALTRVNSMAAMEDQLRKLNPEPPAPEPAPEPTEAPAPDATGESSDPPPPPPPPRQLQLGIARLKWDQFDKIGTSGNHVIDVLIGDPDYMKPRQRKKGAKQTEQHDSPDDKDKKAADNEKKDENESTQPRSASASEKRSLLPERMCINSDLLVKILNEITSLNMVGPLVIIRPFKVLVNWEVEIRQRLEVLEQKEADAVAAKVNEAESLKREKGEQTEGKTENHVESTVSAESSIEKTNEIIETTKSVSSNEKQTEGEQTKDSHDGGSKTENVQADNDPGAEKDPGPKL
ncbi:MAG: hypothetical protein Q9214_005312, partial [Letrouitia sp. 1 TL-2023]